MAENSANEILKSVFGYPSFRPGQAEAVNALLAGQDLLAVMPTGAGKSICYQVPALMMPGITVVVSPLISLMQDQVRSLIQAGVHAAYLNNSLTDNQKALMLQRAAQGSYKIIYVAPERLLMKGFLRLCSEYQQVSMVVVDEAHCISQWGQDFRPSYLQIAEFLKALPRRPVVGAFTATATQRVRDDIEQSLGLVGPKLIVRSFDRPNLYFAVQHCSPSQKDQALLDLLQEHPQESGIIYCGTVRQTLETADLLKRYGFAAAPYNGKMESEERKRNQEDFVFDRVRIIVATNAFGMGIDKPNVRFVIHYNMPRDVESYYQEAGRAGRDGEPADCILLYSGSDVRLAQYLIDQQRDAPLDPPPQTEEEQERRLKEKEDAAKKAEERLKWMTFYATTQECLRSYILRYFGEKTHGDCGCCGSCQAKAEAEKRRQQEEARKAAQRTLANQLFGRRKAAEATAADISLDTALLNALYELRKKTAQKQKVPAYVVFSDATLREIAARKPQSRDELLDISGIGEAKADRYGRAVLELVQKYTV